MGEIQVDFAPNRPDRTPSQKCAEKIALQGQNMIAQGKRLAAPPWVAGRKMAAP